MEIIKIFLEDIFPFFTYEKFNFQSPFECEEDWGRGFSGSQSFEDGDVTDCIDFTDMLFSSLIGGPQSFAFPNPREIG